MSRKINKIKRENYVGSINNCTYIVTVYDEIRHSETIRNCG